MSRFSRQHRCRASLRRDMPNQTTPVIFTSGTIPPGLCFATEQARFNFFSQNLSGYLQGGFTGVIVSASAPTNPVVGQVWIQVDGNGGFVRAYTYQGQWLSQYRVPPLAPERMIWTGPLTGTGGLDSYDGGTSLPTATTLTTGQFWTPDPAFSFAIPMGIGTNAVSYDGNAATVLGALGTLGEERHTLGIAEIPSHSHTGGKTSPGDQPADVAGVPNLYSLNTGFTGGAASSITGGVANAATLSHQNLPPVIGVTFAMRTIRQYYVG